MLPYLLLLFISFITPLVFYRPKPAISPNGLNKLILKRNRMMLLIFFVGFFVLLALRDISVGNDLEEYQLIFDRCIKMPFNKLQDLRWEIGYTFYNKFVSFISKDFRFLLIITAIIILIPIYKLYSKEGKYNILLILLFINMPCFLIIFSGLRQAIAISIGVVAYMAIENKKYIFSAIMIILAVLFHISAVVLILLYPMFFLRIKMKHLLYIVPIMLIVYIFRIPLLLTLFKVLPENYLFAYSEIEGTGAYGMIILFLIFLVFSFVILDETIMSSNDYFMRNALLAATMFQFFVPVHGLIQRASYYFLIFVPLAIISVVQTPKKKLKNISNLAVVVMVCFFAMYFFFHAVYSTDNLLGVFPYKFFWSN